MNDLNPSQKPVARPRADVLFARHGVASVRSRIILILLAGLLALVTPLRADNPPTYLTQFGSAGRGQLTGPGIAVDSSNSVYVADTDRVEKFDRNGNYLTQWGSIGSGNGQFEYSQYIAVDSSNNVYVTDSENHRVEKFTSSGTYLAQWGSYGSGNGQFEHPLGIAVDSSNNFGCMAESVGQNGAPNGTEVRGNGVLLCQNTTPARLDDEFFALARGLQRHPGRRRYGDQMFERVFLHFRP